MEQTKTKKQTREEENLPWKNLSLKKKLEVWIFQKSKLRAHFPTFGTKQKGTGEQQ